MKNEPEMVANREWETEEDTRTLLRASEVMSDRKRIKRVKALLDKQHKGLARMMSGQDYLASETADFD